MNISEYLFKSRLRFKIFAILLLSFCLMTSCKKLVEVGPPNSSLVTTSVFSSDETAIAAQLAVYAILAPGNEGIIAGFEQYTAISSDELTNYATDQLHLDLYRNTLNAQNDGGLNGNWGALYNYIYQENAILENVQGSAGMSNRVKQLMIGEALFMRAYFYFQLVNFFGDVPLVISTDYTKNSSLPRTPAADVYTQIVTDLKTAQGLLSPGYLDASDNTGAGDRVRPTTWAADALLARVYLYMGEWSLSSQQASLVIADSAQYSLVSDLTQVFLMNSNEAIWQLMPGPGIFAVQGGTYILVGPPGPAKGQTFTISPQLLQAFEPNDNRQSVWIGNFSQGGNTWYYPYKYRSGPTSTSLTEYSMVLRLAELYLIRAEAEAQENDLTDAANDLNIIRNRAGLPNTAAVSQSDFLTAIAHERQVELFTEEHRWFDLKRTGTVNSVMDTVAPQKGAGWNSYQQLYPLAIPDLQLNPNLVQNPGY